VKSITQQMQLYVCLYSFKQRLWSHLLHEFLCTNMNFFRRKYSPKGKTFKNCLKNLISPPFVISDNIKATEMGDVSAMASFHVVSAGNGPGSGEGGKLNTRKSKEM